MWNIIIGGIMKYIGLWVDSKHRQALEWQNRTLKGKLSSSVKTAIIEKKIRSAKPVRSTNPAAWNKKARGAILLILFLMASCMSSCWIVYVESCFPIIETTPRPVLPEDPPEWTKREVILVDYAEELELRIEIYNDLATEHNVENDYANP